MDKSKSFSPNRVRVEVEAMGWPTHLPDPDGDRERSLQRAYRRTAFWRMMCLFVLALLSALGLLYTFGAL